MDIPALAKRLSVPERHVRRLVAENRIPYLKWGHLVRFDPRHVEKWLEAAQVPAMRVPPLRSGRPGRRAVAPERRMGVAAATTDGLGEAVADKTAAEIVQLVDQHLGRLEAPGQETG
jgi:excisionase family DNA binding protein